MIPKKYILEWTDSAPWQELYQIEQDLIITKSSSSALWPSNSKNNLGI